MQDFISEIGIDGNGRLYVTPSTIQFPFIYREAMQVQWNAKSNRLYSPAPHQWSYLQWFEQIIRAASEQGCQLLITNDTTWKNIPTDLQRQFCAPPSHGNSGVVFAR